MAWRSTTTTDGTAKLLAESEAVFVANEGAKEVKCLERERLAA